MHGRAEFGRERLTPAGLMVDIVHGVGHNCNFASHCFSIDESVVFTVCEKVKVSVDSFSVVTSYGNFKLLVDLFLFGKFSLRIVVYATLFTGRLNIRLATYG